jgi:hypothetical protein
MRRFFSIAVADFDLDGSLDFAIGGDNWSTPHLRRLFVCLNRPVGPPGRRLHALSGGPVRWLLTGVAW